MNANSAELNVRADRVPLRQFIYADDTGLPDSWSAVTDLVLPDGWILDEPQTEHLRSIGASWRDISAWMYDDPQHGELGAQVYFRTFLDHDLVIELFGDRIVSDEIYNDLVSSLRVQLTQLDGNPYANLKLELSDPDELRINLGGLSLPTSHDDAEPLADIDYTHTEFHELAVKKWLPWVECGSCGKANFCRFPMEDPSRLTHDAVCGVVEHGLAVTLKNAWPQLARESDMQAVIDALYYHTDFVQQSTFIVGNFVSDAQQLWLGDAQASVVLGGPALLRPNLDRLAAAVAKTSLGRRGTIVLVEGEAEQGFLERFWQRRFMNAKVIAYRGKGNSTKTKLLAEQYVADGYEVFLQRDLDGASPDSDQARTFAKGFTSIGVPVFFFKWDFEDAFPRRALVAAAAHLLRADFDETLARVATLDRAKEVLNTLNLSGSKRELGRILAVLQDHRNPRTEDESEIDEWLGSMNGR